MVALDAAGVRSPRLWRTPCGAIARSIPTRACCESRSTTSRAQTAAENKRLENEIAQRVSELRAQIDENNKKAKSEQDEFLAWQSRKHQEEDTIAEGVSYFVSENPITTTRNAKNQGGADVR